MTKPEQEPLLLVFAYAPAGLGHLRVLNALYQGLPKGTNSIILGSDDKFISVFHRFVSIHPLTRAIMEWIQRGHPEDVFTKCYRFLLCSRTKTLYQRLIKEINKTPLLPKTVLVIATHFGLAHQLAKIKDKLMRESGVKFFLAVVVTDDSPQHIWYVPNADAIFVPSDLTKEKLISYGLKSNLPKTKFVVSPYPLSPVLGKNLSESRWKDKIGQAEFSSQRIINVAIPISRAAVGTKFLSGLIRKLSDYSPRFKFHIVSKKVPYTKVFLKKMSKFPPAKLYLSSDDRKIVEAYENMYSSQTIAYEVTKPSEQSFKALLEPEKVGGPILLFSEPVGRQESDNLDFLRRHHLLPDASDSYEIKDLLKKAVGWRCLLLPRSSEASARFIYECLKSGIFQEMLKFRFEKDCGQEISSDGVKIFWEKVMEKLNLN